MQMNREPWCCNVRIPFRVKGRLRGKPVSRGPGDHLHTKVWLIVRTWKEAKQLPCSSTVGETMQGSKQVKNGTTSGKQSVELAARVLKHVTQDEQETASTIQRTNFQNLPLAYSETEKCTAWGQKYISSEILNYPWWTYMIHPFCWWRRKLVMTQVSWECLISDCC